MAPFWTLVGPLGWPWAPLGAPLGALGAPLGPFWPPRVPRNEKHGKRDFVDPPPGSTLAPKMRPKAVQKTHEKTTLEKEASRVHFGAQNGPKMVKNCVNFGVAFCIPFFGPSTSKKVTKIGGFLDKMGAKCSLHSVLDRKSLYPQNRAIAWRVCSK